jgi:hypothetical protein
VVSVRFRDLRHTCITKLAESQASEQTIMAIAGQLTRAMLEHHSHIRMAAKGTGLEGIVVKAGAGVNVHQLPNANSPTPTI